MPILHSHDVADTDVIVQAAIGKSFHPCNTGKTWSIKWGELIRHVTGRVGRAGVVLASTLEPCSASTEGAFY